MNRKIIKKVALAVVCVSLIFILSLCSTGGGGKGGIITWVAVWYSDEDLGGVAGTDEDIFVSRSTDNGATWSAVQTLNSNAITDNGNDQIPSVITDGKGNWVAVWYSDEDLGGTAGTDWDIFFSRSTNNGATWSAVQTLNTNATTDSGSDFEPRVSTDGNGNWIAVWYSTENLGGTAGTDYDIFVARSADNGATWSAVQILNSNANTDTQSDYEPNIITDGNGNWVAVWYSFEDLGGTAGTDTDIFVARSADNGATWSAVQTLNSNATTDSGGDYWPNVITDGNGTWVAVWYSDEDLGGTAGTDWDIFFSRSTNNGATWSTVQTLNSNATTDSGGDYEHDVITDSKGNWVAVWYSYEDLGGTVGTDADIFFSRSTDNGATWSAVQVLNSNAITDTGGDYYPYVITDGCGNWVTVWASDEDLGGTAGTDSDIFFSRSTNNGATWSAVQTLNSNATTDSGGDFLVTD